MRRENRYTSPGASAEWQQGGKALAETRATVWKGKIEVTEPRLKATVECEAAGEGAVGVGATGKITAWKLSKCFYVAAGFCEKLENVVATEVPWSSELTDVKGVVGGTIKAAKEFGFQFTCTVSGTKFTPKCQVPSLATPVENVVGGVKVSFSATTAKCVFSELEEFTGHVEGSGVMEATTGGKLEVAGKEGVFTKVSGPLEVKGTGKLTLEDKYLKFIFNCQVKTTGKVESAGKGTITGFTTSACETTGCQLQTVTAIGLPWKTELHEREGRIDESLVSGGSGAPQWRFTCLTSGGWEPTETCGLNVSPFLVNGSLGNVNAQFNEERVTCSLDGGENEAVWRGELTIEHPASVAELEVK